MIKDERKIVDLPNGYERCMRLGKEAYLLGQYEEARDLFEQAHELEKNIASHMFIVKSNIKLEEYTTAYQWIKEKEYVYQTEPELAEIYFNVLSELFLFLKIDSWLGSQPKKISSIFLAKHEQRVDYWTKVDTKKYEEVITQVSDLPSLSNVDQIQRVKQTDYLTTDTFFSLAKNWLMDSRVSPITRVYLFERLVLLGYHHPVKMLDWENQTQEITPSQTNTLQMTYQHNLLLDEMSRYLSTKQPSLLETFRQTIRLHIGLMYPFQDTIMLPVSTWLDAYLCHYGVKELRENHGQASLNDALLKIKKLDEVVTTALYGG